MNFNNQRNINFLKTDVLPSELPILFSNKPIQNNIEPLTIDPEYRKQIEKNLFLKYTVPLNFNIRKKSDGFRRLSLPHPLAQLNMLIYTIRYDKMIIDFAKKSNFSRRSPTKINKVAIFETDIMKNKIRKIEEEYSLIEHNFINGDDVDFLFKGYYSYNTEKTLPALLRSKEFLRSKNNFSYFLKLDINKCFYSIYSHALTWAILGSKELGKNMTKTNYQHLFPNATDKICQKINNNETNGIIVGPEFSRIIAELLLTRVDINLYNYLKKNNLQIKKDYMIYRYVDDYYIFGKNKEVLDIIKKELLLILQSFNLTIGDNKIEEQVAPFSLLENVIIELKKILNSHNHKKLILWNKLKESEKHASLEFKEVLGKQKYWLDMHEQIDFLISKNPEKRRIIVLYFLKSIEFKVPLDRITENMETYKILLNIIEKLSHIYSQHIDNDTTNAYLILMTKFNNEINNVKINFKNEETDCAVIKIQEMIFYQIYRILKYNLKSLDNMYDLIVFMKILPKKLSSQFLCEILEVHKGNYFIFCTIAYYIKNNQSVFPEYKIVLKKLEKDVVNFIKEYDNKGSIPIVLEAQYFYMINDFSKYPLFSNKTICTLKKKFNKDIKEVQSHSECLNLISSESYYDWNRTEIDFERELIKKHIVNELRGDDGISEYSF